MSEYASFSRLTTRFDEMIPFIPEWELIYFFTVILPFFPAMYIKDRHYFLNIIKYFFIILTVCYIVFLTFPVEIVRTLPETNGFFDWGILVNHLADKPVNCFPSFHAAIAFGVAYMLRPLSKPVSYAVFMLAFLISASILFVKAHYIADAIGGYIVAWAGYVFYLRKHKPRKKPLAKLKRTDKMVIVFLLVFTGIVLTFYLVYISNIIPAETLREIIAKNPGPQ